MYKYLCVISDNVIKKNYYDTVAEIKKIYPDCTEHPYAVFDNNEMGQVFIIPDGNGGTSKICVKNEFSKNRIIVMSEIYLLDFYDGKKVEEVFLYSGNSISKTAATALGIGFMIINFIAVIIGFYSGKMNMEISFADVVISLILSVIYTASALLMKIRMDISLPKILFIQFGGYAALAVLPIAFIISVIIDTWGGVMVIVVEIIYLRVVFLAVVITGIITSRIFNAMKKHSAEKDNSGTP